MSSSCVVVNISVSQMMIASIYVCRKIAYTTTSSTCFCLIDRVSEYERTTWTGAHESLQRRGPGS